MRIYNIRSGFANNSSSTHSLAFLPAGTPDSPGNDEEFQDYEVGSFGWQRFVAASSEVKARWLAQHFIHTVQPTCGDAITRAMVQHWLGLDPDICAEDYVDHQSLIHLPHEWSGGGVDKQFFDEFKAFVMRPDVAVIGGNDNDNSPRGDVDYRQSMVGMIDVSREAQIVARKDSRGFWTIFDRRDGTKFRIAIDTDTIRRLDVAGTDKTDTPELVDLKITNKCHMGCEFCYQNSVPKGQHADGAFMYAALDYMRNAKVFEVAIGGGEPILHPGFYEFVRQCRTSGVVPNFTTRNVAWLREPSKALPLLDHIGGWAFSTENASEIHKLSALWIANDLPRAKQPSIQYVVGVGNVYEYEEAVRACAQTGFRLTLLGPKQVGRGLHKTWTNYNWLKPLKVAAKQHVLFKFAIDTALAQQYRSAIKKAGIPDWCYTVLEGKSSMYIDAVDRYIAPSSYSPPETHVKIENPYFMGDFVGQHFPTW